jgi:hypothetical protein
MPLFQAAPSGRKQPNRRVAEPDPGDRFDLQRGASAGHRFGDISIIRLPRIDSKCRFPPEATGDLVKGGTQLRIVLDPKRSNFVRLALVVDLAVSFDKAKDVHAPPVIAAH